MSKGGGERFNLAYEAFREHSSDLLTAIQDELTVLAWDLFTKTIIPANVREAATFTLHNKGDRASKLLEAVGSRIAVDPGTFDVFLSVLAKRPSTAELCKRMKPDVYADPPRITSQPKGLKDAVPGHSVTFTVQATGRELLSYQWQWRQKPREGSEEWQVCDVERFPGADSSTLTIPTAQMSNEGSYRCTVSNCASSETSDSATLTFVTQAQPLSLEEEIKHFEKKYEDLVNSVLSGFKTGGVSIKLVLNCLRQLPVSLKPLYGEFLQSQAGRLSRASSIDELFFILSPYWDFLNPSLLVHLAHRFGDEQTTRSVDKYLSELREFRMKTKINNFIDKWTGALLPDTQEIVMELGDNWKEQSLQQLEELRIEVSRKRCFEDYVMPLKRVKVSCVDAIFSLPESIDIHSLELDSLELDSLKEFFHKHQVLRILLNGACILDLHQKDPRERELPIGSSRRSIQSSMKRVPQHAIALEMLSKPYHDAGSDLPKTTSNLSFLPELDLCDLMDIGDYLVNLRKDQIFRLGLVLGLRAVPTLDIMKDSPTFLYDMLTAWLQGQDNVGRRGGHTWGALVKGLRHPSVAQNQIADRIQDRSA